MGRWQRIAVVGVLAVSGCGAEMAGAGDERFAGRWLIEETEAHALYSASTYQLGDDGAVTLVWDAGLYGVPHGQVRRTDTGLVCVFGDRWRSLDEATLEIDGDCSDDAARTIVLWFANDAATNAVGADVHIASVGGESGWQPPPWGWSFRKCASGDPCIPAE